MVGTLRCSLVLVVVCVLLPVAAFPAIADERADAARDLSLKQDDQKRVQAETDRLVRRLNTILRVLAYYQQEGTPEQKLLDEISTTLTGLSREQMADIVRLLEGAEKKPDNSPIQPELDQAYGKHREVIDALRRLLARYEALRGLDEAAQRFDKASRKQLEVQLQTRELSQQKPEPRRGRRDPHRLQLLQRTDDQQDLRRDAETTLEQLQRLKPLLAPDLQDRVKKAEKLAAEQKLAELMREATEDIRQSRPADALKEQARAAEVLQDLSHALRVPRDRLAALRESRQRLDRLMTEQEKLNDATAGREEPKPEKAKDELAAKKPNELGDQQARLQHESRDLRQMVKPHASEVEDQVAKAEGAMKEAQKNLHENAPDKAARPQVQAMENLEKARAQLDEMIAEAERKRNDPLQALKRAEEKLDKILQDQKQARQKTVEAEAGKQESRLPQLARTQDDLARRTDDLMHQPMPAKPETQKALDKALQAMDKATDQLDKKKGPEAVAQQDKAIQSLEEAKKQLAQQAAAIQQRREEMAKLEQAGQQLEEMAKRERELAEKARSSDTPMANADQPKKDSGKPDVTAKANEPMKSDLAAKPGEKPMPQARSLKDEGKPMPTDPRQQDATKALAKEQAEMRKQAESLGRDLQKSAPEASKSVGESTEKMQAAEKNLEKSQRKPAAENAEMAADKLMEARDQLAKAKEQNQAREAADEAMTRPNEIDLANTAAQLSDARQKAMQAAEQSKQAAKQLQQQAMKAGQPQAKPGQRPDEAAMLAEMQKEIAQQAEQMGLKEAVNPAERAASALERGELTKATPQQKRAMEQLRKAGKGESGMPPSGGAAALAEAQKTLLEATEALAKSQAANEEAMAALEQAKAQAPSALQPGLQQAGQNLQQAGEQLPRGQAQQANQLQRAAAGQLGEALQAVQQAMAMQQQGQQPTASRRPSPQKGQQPGQQQANQGQGQERNENQGSGNRTPDGQGNNADSKLTDAKGDGTFVKLPARDRDVIRQSMQEKLPPEYAAQIQQYYINIAKGKAANKPAERK